ncbi:hypothetical protein NCH01_28770 [Neoasaia chiangmaiensis]|uniref:Uncharacterized protein n=1 Tax=Neoasaia chiangmaiensis TaxID=320497 RepID=A0A1U9KLQ1_9PROT|nr:hypothetical protein A0U93_00675 [Neoasaia chiangmaiensis]GEN16446.1 hypothetical protein NCH01_28770 [Neoasaia chiangmaiensis]
MGGVIIRTCRSGFVSVLPSITMTGRRSMAAGLQGMSVRSTADAAPAIQQGLPEKRDGDANELTTTRRMETR